VVRRRATSPPSRTEAARVEGLRDEEIDLSDLPELSPRDFARGLVRKGLRPLAHKSQITLRIDTEVVEWFRAKGAGYQSQMNAVLKAFKEAQDDHLRSAAIEPRKRSGHAPDVIEEDDWRAPGAGRRKSLAGIVRDEDPAPRIELPKKKRT